MNKTCTNCKQSKPVDCFHKNKSRSDGLSHVCKVCRKQHSFEYNKKLDHSSHYAKHSRYYKNKANYRKESIKLATPTWLTAEQKVQINSFYLLADDCRITSGELYQVDHIVPLKGTNICGLHVPWNLQVLPSDINIKKSNKI